MLKKLTSVETYDHPLVFVFFLALMLIPVLVALYSVARKLNVPVPGLSINNQG